MNLDNRVILINNYVVTGKEVKQALLYNKVTVFVPTNNNTYEEYPKYSFYKRIENSIYSPLHHYECFQKINELLNNNGKGNQTVQVGNENKNHIAWARAFTKKDSIVVLAITEDFYALFLPNITIENEESIYKLASYFIPLLNIKDGQFSIGDEPADPKNYLEETIHSKKR